MKPIKHLACIEPLEARVAPAAIINPYTVTYQDTSGNTDVIHISKPLFNNATNAAKILSFSDSSGNIISDPFGVGATTHSESTIPANLAQIYLLGNNAASGLNISVQTIPQAGVATGQANVGYIDAGDFTSLPQVTGSISLGNIYIQGDLGGISAGSNTFYFGTPAIRSLDVLSMSQGTDQSFVLGPIGSMTVHGNFNTNLEVIGSGYGSISTLKIGSLAGDTLLNSDGSVTEHSYTGFIKFFGRIGSATIGNITGTAADHTGELLGVSTGNLPSSIGSLHIGSVQSAGSITGGGGLNSGSVSVAVISSVVIDGDLVGGTAGVAAASSTSNPTAGDTGTISATVIGSVSITGSIIGGDAGTHTNSSGLLDQTANTSGAIVAASLGSLTVGGSITGGTGPSSGYVGFADTNGGVAPSVAIGTLIVHGDVTGGGGLSSGFITASKINTLAIGGNLTGGAGTTSGAVEANLVGSLTIDGGIAGGSGSSSGDVSGIPQTVFGFQFPPSVMKYGSVAVHGDVQGGTGANSGSILIDGGSVGSLGSLSISGSLIGNSGANSGEVDVTSTLGTLLVGHNVTGGSASDTGEILAGALVKATINGNFSGGSIDSTAVVVDSGYIAATHIGALTIHGNASSGSNTGTGATANIGAIRSSHEIGSITIDGAVTGSAANPFIISAAHGIVNAALHADLAIGKISLGATTYADILAGYDTTVGSDASTPLGMPVDGSVQIGTVNIAGNLSFSNIVAGAQVGAETNSPKTFGSADNTAITAHTGSIQSSIASIIVSGNITGATGTFGFVAQNLDAVKVNGASVLPASFTKGTPVQIGSTDTYLLEVK